MLLYRGLKSDIFERKVMGQETKKSTLIKQSALIKVKLEKLVTKPFLLMLYQV